jgi:hypothetical protein
MRSVEVTRAGDLSVSDQLAEMQRWLDAKSIRASDLRAVSILRGRVTFGVTLQNEADVDRFIRAFGDLGWQKR